ncbi:HD domain-containing protein [Candidatus Acetothermia bacterium]|jgi:metal-dependent HD superfamily phosphatase/phosphodiesterase|nr:HD domain-containing protein [Candidatus Acetothermia bacterium]MCI2431437.1 HD domain-containing protein [Candidatus Acetothermia bacterium]MCI2437143.1 HD domain-containing protein [Candidatus Acetothermia bacterium]
MPLNIPVKQNKKLETVVQRINENITISTYWYCSNITAIDRMGINDHGPVHIRIVANLALKILRMLIEANVQPSVEKHHKLTRDDAEVIVVLAAALHDIGHIVHRANHEPFSVALAANLLSELLVGLYEPRERAIITAEVLHAIYAHDTHVEPLTVEAGALKIADALDMEEGRARIPFKAGSLTIHAVSATAIEDVQIRKGDKRPICIEIKMSNSAGIFQIDNLLKEKLKRSGLAEYFEIRAEITGEEKKLIERYEL